MFTEEEIRLFSANGFIVVRALSPARQCDDMLRVIHASLDPPLAPLEFETDIHYPGAPTDRLSPGGDTPRRLLHAYIRDQVFRQWATSPAVARRVRQLLAADTVQLSQNHHNCIMTKHPGYSSATLWHQDIRYWLFDRPDLISVWLALGDEHAANGGIQLIPGSHNLKLDRGRYDAAYFLRQDIAANNALIATAEAAALSPGDALFFHSETLHAAGRNNTDKIKLSVVFTYHAADNQPIADSRSSNYPDIVC